MDWYASTNLEKEVKTAVKSFYGSVGTRLVFTSKRMLPVARKDVVPTTQKSSVIYEYKCRCDTWYVGRTSQRLQDRIKQYVPQWLRQQLTCPRRSQPHRSSKRKNTKRDCDSAIGQHLLENDQCASNYDDKRFSILATARSSFYFNLLEAAYIKTQRPALCRQKKFVYALKLFRQSRRLASCCSFSNFHSCEIFLSRALQYWRYHWLVFIAYVQINHIKHFLTLGLSLGRDVATNESVTKSL